MADSKGKGSVKTVIGVLLALGGGFFLTNVGLAAALGARNVKKLEGHTNENNSVYSYLFQKTEHCIKPDTRNAFITNLSGSIDIIVPRPEADVMNIEITSIIGKVNIELPTGVRINCEGSNHLNYEEEGPEDGPVINLKVTDYLTSLTISFEEE
ncbi:MAG: hypothetical protein J6U50_07360 [Lachnospiraceae bacterium]|nr:hypothetical protein [Lachnospiraceae bacterium]